MKWSGSNDSYEQPPIGTHIARCVRLIDLGTQEGEYEGKKTSRKQVIIGWELPQELIESGEAAGKPFLVTAFYTASLNEKANLRKHLAAWRTRDFTPEELAGFEAKKILGTTCLVSITEKDSGRHAVTGVMALPKGTKAPKQINPSLYFSLDEGEFDPAVFSDLSDGIRGMIEKSPEYQERVKQMHDPDFAPNEPDGGDFDDEEDIPF